MIRWSAMLSVDDMQPRRSRYGTVYCVLYTNANQTVCCDEKTAQRVALYEPYMMKGFVHPYNGGVYLRVEKLEKFDSASFKNVF